MSKITNNHSANTIDESPKAYKNIFEVMELQKELVEVIDRCIPILNIKGYGTLNKYLRLLSLYFYLTNKKD